MWITLWITQKVIHSFHNPPVDNLVIHILSTAYPHPPVDNSWRLRASRVTACENKHIIAKQSLSKIVVLLYFNTIFAFGMSYPHIYINLWITLWIFFKTLHKTNCKNFPFYFVQCFMNFHIKHL